MKKVLVVYATREGQTEKVATYVSDHLKHYGASVKPVNAMDEAATNCLVLDKFDMLVFGASMHAGGLEREIIEFINQNVEQIEQKPRSFFLVLLSAATKDPVLRSEWLEDARNKMDEQLRIKFEDVEMIPCSLI